jgi:hypothetical protein
MATVPGGLRVAVVRIRIWIRTPGKTGSDDAGRHCIAGHQSRLKDFKAENRPLARLDDAPTHRSRSAQRVKAQQRLTQPMSHRSSNTVSGAIPSTKPGGLSAERGQPADE